MAVAEFPASEDEAAQNVLGNIGKTSPWNTCPVAFLLPAGDYQFFQLEAPQVPRAEWKAALQWPLQEAMGSPVAEVTYDILDIPTAAHAPGRPKMVYAVTVKNSVALANMLNFRAAGLPLSVIDVPELALRNISAMLETANRGQACLHFDASGGLLVITFEGELYSARRIDLPLSLFSQADAERKAQLFDRVALELQRSFDAFERQYGFITLRSLLLSQQAELSGLAAYLRENLYIPIDDLALNDALDFSRCRSLENPQQQARYLLAIGAALRDVTAGQPREKQA
ncbi:MAG: hypothetical protein LBG69_03300 [Zoogloeaceae bacterium]|jgi:MSHA biogenesis protein MshI|nr:hypothetical protein [Zoogloeaceae bacterium]